MVWSQTQSNQIWKTGKITIRTLADLQSSIEKRAEQWLKSNQAQQIINTKCVIWFNNKIQPELAEETDPFVESSRYPEAA